MAFPVSFALRVPSLVVRIWPGAVVTIVGWSHLDRHGNRLRGDARRRAHWVWRGARARRRRDHPAAVVLRRVRQMRDDGARPTHVVGERVACREREEAY